MDRLAAVSRRLGDVVLDPAIWPELMEDICKAIDTTGAILLQSDIRTADVPKTASTSELFKAYFSNNLHVNDIRAARGVPLMLAGKAVVSDEDLFPDEKDMLRDPLYATLGELGFRWWAAVGFQAGSALWGLALQRTVEEGPFDAREKQALTVLSRRLTETATLSKAVGRLVLSGITNGLQLVRRPAIAVDRLGFVVDTNALANGIFDEDIRIKSRRLFVQDKLARSRLDSFTDMLKTMPDTEPLPAAPIVVRRENKQPVIIHILPVDGAARSPFLGARAILAFFELGPAIPDPGILVQALNLSPAEARLALLIATGLSTERAAEKLGVTRETARAQLKAVFAKTGTHRQGELVALLARL